MRPRAPITFGSSQGALGDSLFLTPILRAFPGSTIRMFDNAHCRNMAQIYEGLAGKIEFVDEPGTPATIYSETQVTQRILNALGAPQASVIPYVIVTDEEKAWATKYLSQYGNTSHMMVITAHNSGWKDPNNYFARLIKPAKEGMQAITDIAIQRHGYTILQFCNNPGHFNVGIDNFEPLERTIHIRGLTLRQTAACYSVIGRMVAMDTGDPYLMLAAGGKAIYLMGPEAGNYRHFHHAYYPEMWKGEPIRAIYYTFEEAQHLIDYLDFDFSDISTT